VADPIRTFSEVHLPMRWCVEGPEPSDPVSALWTWEFDSLKALIRGEPDGIPGLDDFPLIYAYDGMDETSFRVTGQLGGAGCLRLRRPKPFSRHASGRAAACLGSQV